MSVYCPLCAWREFGTKLVMRFDGRGYHVAFIGAALFSALAVVLAATLLGFEEPAHAREAVGVPATAEAD